MDLTPKAAGTATRSKRQDFERGAVQVLYTFCESISPIARFHFVVGKELYYRQQQQPISLQHHAEV